MLKIKGGLKKTKTESLHVSTHIYFRPIVLINIVIGNYSFLFFFFFFAIAVIAIITVKDKFKRMLLSETALWLGSSEQWSQHKYICYIKIILKLSRKGRKSHFTDLLIKGNNDHKHL